MAGTRWVVLDVDYFRNAKALAAGRDGRALHLASICWMGSMLRSIERDGIIPESAIRTVLRDADVPRRAIDLVVDAGLWVPNGHGFELHDFVAMNGTRADAEAKHQLYLDRQRRYNAKRKERRHDDAT